MSPTLRRRWPAAAVTAVAGAALLAAGCVSSEAPRLAAQRRAAALEAARNTTTTTSTTTTTTSTTTPPTTAAPAPVPGAPAVPPPPPPGMGPGARGPEVLALEERLVALKYDPGKVDDVYDAATGHAVMAFQKANGLPRTSRATDDVLAAVTTAGEVPAMLAEGGPNRIEIDLKRQILLLFQNGTLVKTLSASTGNNKRYCVDGSCAVAVTPGGSFKVSRKIRGLRVSRLGKLYNPLYFNGGIAIHGSPSVPAGPASHGCVRIPMHVSLWFHDNVPSGTPVYVIGGKTAPVPFDEPEPTDVPGATTVPVPATPAPVPTTVPAPPTTVYEIPTTLPLPVPTPDTTTPPPTP
ncbi:MAG TPA: L,D-transpeptidase family protein [Acidimicrobiales bacterium]|nr:L,D-transpeptidase family protein [Acidimicrobiales bacterium]